MPRARCLLVVIALAGCARPPAAVRPPTARLPQHDLGTVAALDFHGWQAMLLRNRHTEVVVVPAIGRVMSLGFAGDGGRSDPFWRHDRLGPSLTGDENGWINYGGDKAWPAPQSDWEQTFGKGWPPPATFDASAYTVTQNGTAIELVSPVDPACGLRIRRLVTLRDEQAFIHTVYEKVEGAPVRVAVWTITQLVSPDRMFALLPEASAFPGGHRSLLPAAPKDLTVDGRLLGMARHPSEKTMVANDADALLWVGPGRDLMIENVGTQPADKAAARPGGAHAQIYTSPDGAEAYVELELMGPLVELAPGQSTEMDVRYRLIRREKADPVEEARRVLADELGGRP